MRARSLLQNSYLMLLGLVLVILTGCGNKEPIKIGFVGSLTGLASESSVSGRNGAMLAIDNINQAGGINGRPVKLIIKDDLNDPQMAIKVDQELVAEGVVAILGHFTSEMDMAVRSYINQEQALLISPTASTEILTGLDDNLLRIISTNKLQAEMLAGMAISKERLKKVAVIYDLKNRAYTEQIYRWFKASLEKQGGQVILTKTFSTGNNTDFNKLAAELVASGAAGILISANGTDAALLCQRLKQNGCKAKIFSGMWVSTGDFIENGGATVEGVYFPSTYDKNSVKKEFLQFRKQYLLDYREEPTYSSVYTYEATQMLLEVLTLSNNYQPQAIKEAIIKQKRFPGLQQDYFEIDQYGDTARGYYSFVVEDGKFKRLY